MSDTIFRFTPAYREAEEEKKEVLLCVVRVEQTVVAARPLACVSFLPPWLAFAVSMAVRDAY